MFVEVERLPGCRGEATVSLVGLPHEVSSDSLALGASTETLTFAVRTTAASPVGKHKTHQFQARFVLPGGELVQALAAPELRIQQPAPAPVAAQPAPVAQPEAAAQAERPPTRLEKLRREHAARVGEREAVGRGADAEGGEL